MNDIINKSFLVGAKFIPEMHSKQPSSLDKLEFIYTACGAFTNNKERFLKFKEVGDTEYIYRNELDKASCQNDMAYRDFKDLARRAASDKVLGDKAFNIAEDPKYNGYQKYLLSMVYNIFD